MKLSLIAKSILEGAPAKIGPSLSLPKQEEYRKAANKVASILVSRDKMSPEQAKDYITRRIPNHPEFTSLVSQAIDSITRQSTFPSGVPADTPKPISPNQPGIAGRALPRLPDA